MSKKTRKSSKSRKSSEDKKAFKGNKFRNTENKKKTNKPNWAARYKVWRKYEYIKNMDQYSEAAKLLGISVESYLERFVNERYKRPKQAGIGGKGLN